MPSTMPSAVCTAYKVNAGTEELSVWLPSQERWEISVVFLGEMSESVRLFVFHTGRP